MQFGISAKRAAAAAAVLGGAWIMGATGSESAASTFGDDLKFLQAHTDAVALADASGQAQVIVVPQYQGRVMTSTASGLSGLSFGWINRELIASGKPVPHMNPYGGEDRVWLGPEGGQFALFFKKGDPFDLDHWQTPAMMDTDPFELVSRTQTTVTFKKRNDADQLLRHEVQRPDRAKNQLARRGARE